MASRPHTTAFLAWLRGHPKLAQVVYDGEVPGQPPPQYALVFAHSPEDDTEAFAGPRRPRTIRHTVHSVGQTPSQAQWMRDWVAERAVPFVPGAYSPSVRLTVAGRVQGPIRRFRDDAPRFDAPVYFYADEYEWEIR